MKFNITYGLGLGFVVVGLEEYKILHYKKMMDLRGPETDAKLEIFFIDIGNILH